MNIRIIDVVYHYLRLFPSGIQVVQVIIASSERTDSIPQSNQHVETNNWGK